MADAPPGTPYHRIARTVRYRWWVPPVALVILVALVFLLQVLVVNIAGLVALLAGSPPEGTAIFGWVVPDFAVTLILTAMMIPAALLTARFVQRRRMGSLVSVEGRLRGRWLLICLGLALCGVAASLVYHFVLNEAVTPGQPFLGPFEGAGTFAIAVVVIALFMPFQAAGEEIALRGFLMQAVGSYGAGPDEAGGGRALDRFLRGPVLAILVSGGVFALLHNYDMLGKADVAVFGLAIAWLTWYTGGIEAAIALHVLHNALGMGLSAYHGTLADAGTGAADLANLAGTVIEVGVYTGAVVLAARWLGLRRTVPGTEPAEPPAAPSA
ncbi:CAAX prenyl protease-like protein [Murinocardiopsis flavida]|uniref:CAAX prenyl protease-like protein n=1 Tax=Murinocardiopsis flavida TaxID=645275 RepID=A0A2P8DJJ2_9ACTN|nr:CPBP family intramembrane glutamic endopeptidase [Murinocardiopsis flavida]PSK97358.1 CAAX prenyl protease-like protein [Murinocardiopsis flavida]